MDNPKLKALLDRQYLLPEEVEMWMRLGFYVSIKQIVVPGYTTKGSFFTSEAREWHIPIEAAIPLREALIKYYRPGSKAIIDDELDIEVQRG